MHVAQPAMKPKQNHAKRCVFCAIWASRWSVDGVESVAFEATSAHVECFALAYIADLLHDVTVNRCGTTSVERSRVTSAWGVLLSGHRRGDRFAPVRVVTRRDRHRVKRPNRFNRAAFNRPAAVPSRDGFLRFDQAIRVTQHARPNLKPLFAARAPDAMRRVRKMTDLHVEPLLELQVLFDPHDVAIMILAHRIRV